MEKLNAYEKHDGLNIDERRMQLVYLVNDTSETAEKKGLTYEDIGELVGYAASTVRCYAYKFAHLLDEARRKFCSVVKDIIEGIVYKAKVVFGKGTKMCYLFKFYDSNGDLLFSKVGTTERTINARLNEELRQYGKKFDVCGVVVESVIDCGNIPPEGAEGHIKGYFIKQYPEAYEKNDRFMGVDLSVEDFNREVNDYLGIKAA